MFHYKFSYPWILRNHLKTTIFLDVTTSWSSDWYIVNVRNSKLQNFVTQDLGDIIMEDRD